MTKRIDFESKSGNGIQGELAEPGGTGKAPGLIVIQEWWGVNDHIRSYVDRFAKEGFIALAPDLYHGKTTKDGGEAAKLLGALDWSVAVQDVAGALAVLEKHPRVNGKIGITGFCMGGGVALVSAAQLPAIKAVVPFYGIGDPKTDLSHLNGPVLGHFSKTDDYVTPAAVQALAARLQESGKKAEIHMYDASHAFMNDTRPEVYDAAASKLGWERTIAFLHRELG
jgi:carboxymethylenebutenolidase